MTAASRQTLLANLIQQVCAAVLLLVLPNMLDKTAYAEIVFVGVLLSFIALADMGLSLVYGRIVPALITQGDSAAVRRWDAAALEFGLLAAVVFSVLIAGMYWFRFGHAGQALLLLLLPVVSFWISFHVTRVTVTGDFSEYRRAIGIRSVASLLAIPMVAVFGLMGWFVSQLVAALLVMGYIGRSLLEPFGRVDWALVRRHIPEGLMLCAITVLWVQLLNFGRLYASLRYPVEAVAHYGVAGAAYQSLSTLLISAFLPISVGVLRRFGQSDQDAFSYTEKTLKRTVWWTACGALVAVEMAPLALDFFFPKYQFDAWMLFALLLGIVFYPFLILLGNCLVGKQRGGIYLALILSGLGVATVVSILVDWLAPGQGAAWGQLLGLLAYSLGLFLVVRSLFAEHAAGIWRRVGKMLFELIFLVLLYAGLRWGWGWGRT